MPEFARKALFFLLLRTPTSLLAIAQALWLTHYFPGWRSWLLAMILSGLIGAWRTP